MWRVTYIFDIVVSIQFRFQSTLSVWRVTTNMTELDFKVFEFQSTLSVWRVTVHKLINDLFNAFQSTLSVWRVTPYVILSRPIPNISIHTLRVESDAIYNFCNLYYFHISIHTLRVESDLVLILPKPLVMSYFNPHSPCGE